MKKITLYAYKISSTAVQDAPKDFIRILKTEVESRTSVKERQIQLNKKAPDTDCILNIESVSSDLFGLFARLVPGDNIGEVPDGLLDQRYITSAELIQGKEKVTNYKRLTYFYVGADYVIMNFHSSTSLQNYFNILSKREKEGTYKLHPITSMPDNVALSDIKNINIADSFNISMGSESENPIKKFCSFFLNTSEFKNLIGNNSIAQELVENDIVSAEILLRLARKPKDMSKEDYERITSNTLALGDDNISLTLKNGKRIQGGEVRKLKEIEVEIVSDNLLDEVDIKLKMAEFMKELEAQ